MQHMEINFSRFGIWIKYLSLLILLSPQFVFAVDCQHPVSKFDHYLCETPALLEKERQVNALYNNLQKQLWPQEQRRWSAMQPRIAGLGDDEMVGKTREQLLTQAISMLDDEMKVLKEALKVIVEDGPSEAMAKDKICRPGQFCNLERKGKIGQDSSGHMVLMITNDSTPLEAETAAQGCWPLEWWRISYDGHSILKADIVVVERGERADPDHNCSYGAGGAGGEEVSILKGALDHAVDGGTNWRWSENTSWRLIPELIKTTKSTGEWAVNIPAYAHTTNTDYLTGTTGESLKYILCTREGGEYQASTADFDQIPVIDSTKYPQFDWRHSELPAQLRVCADGKREKNTAGFVVSRTKPRHAIDGSVASISVMALDYNRLLIEVDDDAVVNGTQSWVTDSHIELWMWPHPPEVSSRCLIPSWSKSLMKPVTSNYQNAADNGVDAIDGAAPVNPGLYHQWGIRTADGQIFRGFGSAEPGMLDGVEMSKIDARHTRFLLHLPIDGAFTVLYSTRSADGKQHLFGTSKLRYGDPTSLGKVQYNVELLERLQADKQRAKEALSAKNSEQKTVPPEVIAIFSAADRGDVQTLREILGKNSAMANTVSPAGDGFTVLMAAVSHGQIEAATALLDAGAQVNARTINSTTALHYAVGAIAPAEYITGLRATGATRKFVRTPPDKWLILAKLLLARHAEVNIRDSGGDTPLLRVVSKAGGAPLDLIKLLIDNKADIWIADEDGKSILIRALLMPQLNTELLQYLITASPKQNQSTKYGVTPLMLAAGNSDESILKAVLENMNPDQLNAINMEGSTALHYAALAGKLQNVKMLLKWGAKIDIANQAGNTPLRDAQVQGCAEIVDVFKAAGAKDTVKENLGASINLLDSVNRANIKANDRRTLPGRISE